MGRFLIGICIVAVASVGCETAKKILGTSTQALEEARVNALAKTYDCSFNECYESVLGLQRMNRASYSLDKSTELLDHETYRADSSGAATVEAALDTESGLFDIFRQDRVRGMIIVMGIKGNVDTTEVGIFFDRIDSAQTRLEISSLSSIAKRKVADGIFSKLDSEFGNLP